MQQPRLKKPEESKYEKPSMRTVTVDELQAFADRLHSLMVKQGLNASDLARAAFGTRVDADGKERAKDRDKIGLYLKGKGLPGEEKMRQLAQALDIHINELAPKRASRETLVQQAAASITSDSSALSELAAAGSTFYKMEHVGKGSVLLAVHMRMPAVMAAEILALLSKVPSNAR